MKTKQLIVIALLMLCFVIVNAQTDKKKYYFVTKKDTVFCKELSYGANKQGYLNKLVYVDMQGKKTELKGKDKVPDVLTFHIDSVIFDKVPLRADKPGSYIRYTQRVVDGKLKVYLAQQGYNKGTMVYNPGSHSAFNHNGYESTGGPSGIYRFFLKMPNGIYYKINDKKNMNNFIKPYLMKCKEFANEYKGDFSTKEEPFQEMIKLYNSYCK